MLLAPQTASELGSLKVKYPNVKVALIPREFYGKIDAAGILDFAQKEAGDY